MATPPKIRFTKHALEKADLLKHYGFAISQRKIIETILKPDLTETKDSQHIATRILDRHHALRVIYEKRKDYYSS